MTNAFNPLLYAEDQQELVEGRNFYEVDTAQAIPAMLGWLYTNRDALTAVSVLPDGALVNMALGGDWLARFTLSARQLVKLASDIIRDYPDCLELAAQPVETLTQAEAVQRAFTIYLARLFFTEALQQAITPPGASVKAPLKDHWSKAEEWRVAGTQFPWPPLLQE